MRQFSAIMHYFIALELKYFSAFPLPWIGVSVLYWSKLGSQFNCGINFDEQSSLATFIPFVFLLAVAFGFMEAAGMEMRTLKGVNFMDDNMQICAR